MEASPRVGREEKRKESGGGRRGGKSLLYYERKLSHAVESNADGGWEARNLVSS